MEEISEAAPSANGHGRFQVQPREDGVGGAHDNYAYTDTHTNTYYSRTFGHNTLDPVPNYNYYCRTGTIHGKKAARATIYDLHATYVKDPSAVPSTLQHVYGDAVLEDVPDGEPVEEVKPPEPILFGWFRGVMMRVMVNIWGVLMYLRLPWITAQAGIGLTWVIVLVAVIITSISGLSISAISNNGKVARGGTYFMVSRTLGYELGAPFGILYSFAAAVGIAMHTVGFAETLRDILHASNLIMVDKVNDIRIIGVITVTFLLAIAMAGLAWENKAQLIFFVLIIISLLNYLLGTVMPATPEKMSKGFFNYNAKIFSENFTPVFRNTEFFRLFGVFFPAVTGILAGANICGDLKDPASAIPKGTLLAILTTALSYLIINTTIGAVMLRDASGLLSDSFSWVPSANATNSSLAIANGSTTLSSISSFTTSNDTATTTIATLFASSASSATAASVHVCNGSSKLGCELGWNFTACSLFKPDTTSPCTFGFVNNYQVMAMVSAWAPLIYAGIFGAALSSALANLISAPKCFQGVARDNIYPGIGIFGKGFGRNQEPLFGYLFAYIISICFIIIAELNIIAPIISCFFIISYTILNFSCFHASFIKTPGWRPDFKFYHPAVSFIGAVLNVIVMFLLLWWGAIIAFGMWIILYLYVIYRRPDVNWGSSMQAMSFNTALYTTLTLDRELYHVKNYRPNCLVLTGPPNLRPALVDFVGTFTKDIGLMVCGNVLVGPKGAKVKELLENNHNEWLHRRKVNAFYTGFVATNMQDGAFGLLQSTGIGKLRPNILIVGFKNMWQEEEPINMHHYIQIIHDVFDLNMSLGILRVKEGIDITSMPETHVNMAFQFDANSKSSRKVAGLVATSALKRVSPNTAQEGTVQEGMPQISTVFQFSQGKRTIDIYWLFDDGGLTLLLPYLLSKKKRWRHCKIRVFMGGKLDRLEEDKQNMTRLITRFRLDVDDVIILTDVNKKPRTEKIKQFEDMISPFRLNDGFKEEAEVEELRRDCPWKVSDHELLSLRDKTYRQLKLNELMIQNSSDAALIVVSLPMIQKGRCPSALGMAWLEVLSRDLPPVLIMRGNHVNVLTIYSQ
ncbi:solute carrier family 12 member 3-like [Lampetra fluviatilis]